MALESRLHFIFQTSLATAHDCHHQHGGPVRYVCPQQHPQRESRPVAETASALRHTSLDLSCLQTVQSAAFETSLLSPWAMFADCLCALQDPSIKQMAEQIAQDPAFAQMAQAMQGGGGMPPGKLRAEAYSNTKPSPGRASEILKQQAVPDSHCGSCGAVAVGMMPPGFPGAPGAAAAGAGAQGSEGGSRSAEEAAAAAMADPSAYADAMSGVFANPQFLEMAEKLGQQLMQVGVVQHRRCRCAHLDAAHQSMLVEQHLLPGSGPWPDPSACNGACCCPHLPLPLAAATELSCTETVHHLLPGTFLLCCAPSPCAFRMQP